MPDNTFAALSILRQAQNSSFDAQSRAEVAGIKTGIGAKMDSFKAAKDQAHGEQMSSIVKVGGGAAGLGLNYKTSILAGSLSAQKGDTAAKGAGLTAASQGNGVGNVVSSATEAMDQQFGGAAQSNAAKVASKQADVQDNMAKSMQDTAKAGKDGAAKLSDSIEEFAKGIITRAQEVISKAF